MPETLNDIRMIVNEMLDAAYERGYEDGFDSDDKTSSLLGLAEVHTTRQSIIESLLRVAVETRNSADPVYIDYVDEDGNRTRSREIQPVEYYGGASPAIVARDLDKAAAAADTVYRRFRIDRIEKLVA